MSLTPNQNRRAAERMAIEQEVYYRALNRKDVETAGAGTTVNISSSGVLFKTERTLVPGSRIELDINWPARLDNKCALKLVARGRIVRFQNGFAALEIIQHEFRTKSARVTAGSHPAKTQ